MQFIHTNIITPIQLKSVDGPKGRFYTVPSGEKYPSITTILGHGEKQWLNDWRESLGPTKADKETKRATDRGTAVHLMTERYLQNHEDPTLDQHISHINEFKSLRLMLNKINNILAQEVALYSDTLKVAGRVDCIAEYKGQLSIIDFKTSANPKDEGMVQDYFLQTTAYALMLGEMYDIHIDNIVIIMSVEKGVPLVFQRHVDNYIEPLLKRINKYYANVGVKV